MKNTPNLLSRILSTVQSKTTFQKKALRKRVIDSEEFIKKYIPNNFSGTGSVTIMFVRKYLSEINDSHTVYENLTKSNVQQYDVKSNFTEALIKFEEISRQVNTTPILFLEIGDHNSNNETLKKIQDLKKTNDRIKIFICSSHRYSHDKVEMLYSLIVDPEIKIAENLLCEHWIVRAWKDPIVLAFKKIL